MNKSTQARLTKLNAKLDKHVDFARNPDDETHAARNAAIGAGVLGAGYAGASIARGRQWQKRVLPNGADNSTAGILGALKTGHRMNVVDASKAVAPAAAAVGSAAAKAGTSISSAAGTVAEKATKAGRSSKAALLIGLRRSKALMK